MTAEETPYDATTYRPLAGSVVIDAGDMSYYETATNGWKEAWLAECGKDYYGNDRVVNGTIDLGCGERQSGSWLTIDDASDGLVVSGADKGESHIADGTSAELTFSRNFTSDQLCTGVEVNGVFHSFGGTTSDVPYAVELPAAFATDYVVSAVYEADQKDWYVSPAGDDSNKGYHRSCPRRTLVEAMKLATANAGHVVHAAAGVYNEGEAFGGGCSNRVVVKDGVGLVADEWPNSESVIQGASATAEGEADSYGNGTNAVRCVYVGDGGYVKGFKLTGGRTQQGDTASANGGGARLANGALVDCEVTGNGCGNRGRGACGGTLIRCYLHDQVSKGDYELYGGSLIDSYIKGACYDCSLILNSTITDQLRANGIQRALNSYLQYVNGAGSTSGFACTNCVFTLKADDPTSSAIRKASSYDEATCKFEVARDANLDEDFRPKTAASPLVDAGSKALYDAHFSSKWAQFKGTDRANGQRIYNGQIDVGCGEYDFRADFAGYLGRSKRAVVAEMGPNVTTNAIPNVVVPDGESITVSVSPKTPGEEVVYELVYTPEGGERTVVSGKTTEALTYTLDGPCTVQSLIGLSRSGFNVLIK